MRFTLRDVLWLCVVVALCLALWVEKRQSRKLATEVRYHTSAVPPIPLIQVPIEDAVHFVGLRHGMSIELDWPSLEKAGIKPTDLVTQNLVDGSLTWAIKRIFLGRDVEVTSIGPNKLRVSVRPKGQ